MEADTSILQVILLLSGPSSSTRYTFPSSFQSRIQPSFHVRGSEFLCLSLPLDEKCVAGCGSIRNILDRCALRKVSNSFLDFESPDAAAHDRTHRPSLHFFVIMSPRANTVFFTISLFPPLQFALLFPSDTVHFDLL